MARAFALIRLNSAWVIAALSSMPFAAAIWSAAFGEESAATDLKYFDLSLLHGPSLLQLAFLDVAPAGDHVGPSWASGPTSSSRRPPGPSRNPRTWP